MRSAFVRSALAMFGASTLFVGLPRSGTYHVVQRDQWRIVVGLVCLALAVVLAVADWLSGDDE